MQDILTPEDSYSAEFEKMMHKAIKKVTNDIEEMKFNTCISTLMTMVNEFYKAGKITKAEFKTFLELLNPFAPHITEELNEIIGFKAPISDSAWPTYDESKTIDDQIQIPVQVNGKLRSTININLDEEESKVKDIVHNNETIKNFLDGKNIVKEIYVKNKIYNIVIK